MSYGEPIPPPPQHGFGQFPRAGFHYPEPFGRDPGDLPRRVGAMDLNSDQGGRRARGISRSRSVKAHSLDEGRASRRYEMHRFVKMGDDWTVADRQLLTMSDRDLAATAKKKSSKSGTVFDQIRYMTPKRLQQIQDLIREKESETGDQWETRFIEEVVTSANRAAGKRNVRSMDVVIARVAGVRAHPSGSRARPQSMSFFGKRSDIRQPELETLSKSKSRTKVDYDNEKPRRRKSGSIEDPDVFGSSKLFHKDGKPQPISAERDNLDEIGLPPHIPPEEPIGRKLHKEDSLDDLLGGHSKSNGKGKGQGHGHGDHSDDDPIVEVHGGSIADLHEIMPGKGARGRGSKKHSKASRSKSRVQSRSRSRSRARSVLTNAEQHRGPLRQGRTKRYFDDSSVSSDEKWFGEHEDDFSSQTSETIHHAAGRERRYSRSLDKEYRDHYPGPASPRDRQKYQGEKIIVPAVRPSHPRVQSLPYTYYPPQRRIEYAPVSPMRSPSPHRAYHPPALYFPNELPHLRRATTYQDDTVQREYAITQREAELRRREEVLHRRSHYVDDPYHY